MIRWLKLAPLLVFLGLLGVLGYYNYHKKAEFAPRELVGKALPSQKVSDLYSGALVDLKTLSADYRRPVLVNVFASWCTPCLAEHPYLLDLKAKGVIIIGINYKDTPINGLNYLNTHSDPYSRTLSDDDGSLGLELGISGVPETFIIDENGVVIDKISGPILPDMLEGIMKSLNEGKPLS
jgi:cytochrome c biogenesis protein CcmG, thiol:disulfide interchange protein DsbE